MICLQYMNRQGKENRSKPRWNKERRIKDKLWTSSHQKSWLFFHLNSCFLIQPSFFQGRSTKKEREHMASRNEKREARHNGEDKPAERGLRWLCFNSSTFSWTNRLKKDRSWVSVAPFVVDFISSVYNFFFLDFKCITAGFFP